MFDAAEERLRLGHKQRGRTELVEERKQQLIDALGWKTSAARAYVRRLPDSYWLAEPPECQLANARQVASAEAQILDDIVPRVVGGGRSRQRGDPGISVFAPDREGLFYRICAGLAAAGRASSMRASTPRATAWRSTICWSRTGRAAPMPTGA